MRTRVTAESFERIFEVGTEASREQSFGLLDRFTRESSADCSMLSTTEVSRASRDGATGRWCASAKNGAISRSSSYHVT